MLRHPALAAAALDDATPEAADDVPGHDPDAARQRQALGVEDLQALLESYRAHEAGVRALCLRCLGDAAAAADATQETFLRAGPRLRYVAPEAVVPYLLVVARRVCAREMARRGREGAVLARLGTSEAGDDPEKVAVELGVMHRVWQRLPERDQALVLYRFAGYSYEEIGRRLGVTTNAVGLALQRARIRARRALDRLLAITVVPVLSWRARRRLLRTLRASGGPRVRGGGALRMVAVAGIAAGSVGASVLALHQRGDTTSAVAAASPAAVPPLDGVVVAGAALSPRYASDHTIWAAGYRVRGCTANCAVLFRSNDAGSTWRALPATGFRGGTVMPVAPSAAGGATVLLSATPDGLQRSDDGGATFTTVTPLTGPAAAVRRTDGAWDVLIASQPTWIYGGDGRLEPGPSLPPDVVRVNTAVASGRPGEVFMAAQRVHLDSPNAIDPVVLRCSIGGRCIVVLTAPEAAASQLAAGVDRGGTITVAVASGTVLRVSHDDGTTFTPAHPAWRGAVTAIAVQPSGAVMVVAGAADGAVTAASVDHAGRVLWTVPLAGGAPAWLLPFGDRDILAGVVPSGGGGAAGLRCSTDGGWTWGRFCGQRAST